MSTNSRVAAFCAILMCGSFVGVVASADLEPDMSGEVAGCVLLQTGIHLQPNPLLDQGIEGRTSQEFDTLALEFQQASQPIAVPLGDALLQQPARWATQNNDQALQQARWAAQSNVQALPQQPQLFPQYLGMPSADQQLRGLTLADRGSPRIMQQLPSPSMPVNLLDQLQQQLRLQEVQSTQARVQALADREASLESTLAKAKEQAEVTKKEMEAARIQAQARTEKQLANEAARNKVLEAELLELKRQRAAQRQRSMRASDAESRAILLMKHVQAAEEKVRRTENVIRNLLPRLTEGLSPADRQRLPNVDQAE